MWHFMMYFMASDDSTFHSNVTGREINKALYCGRVGNREYSNVCIISVEVKVLLIQTRKRYKLSAVFPRVSSNTSQRIHYVDT